MRLLRIALLQASQYAIVVANLRFIAAGSYLGTAAMDAAILLNGIVLTKFVVQARTPAEWAAVAIGGAGGSTLALWLSKTAGF
jgi:hypothetical protein